jgi:prepilin-type N-terminal cleavage/methylation domain-containing protein
MRVTTHSKAGFTLLEVLVAAILISMIFGALSMMMKSGTAAFHQGVSSSTAEAEARRGIDRITAQFSAAESAQMLPQIVPFLGSSTLTFHRSTGALGGVIAWGNNSTIQFQMDASEGDDGLDNDGDGLIDEGRVVLIENVGLPNQQTTVLCPNVREYLEGEIPNGLDDNGNGLTDEQGLSFNMLGTTLVVRLTVERANQAGRRTWKTLETSVWVRN